MKNRNQDGIFISFLLTPTDISLNIETPVSSSTVVLNAVCKFSHRVYFILLLFFIFVQNPIVGHPRLWLPTLNWVSHRIHLTFLASQTIPLDKLSGFRSVSCIVLTVHRIGHAYLSPSHSPNNFNTVSNTVWYPYLAAVFQDQIPLPSSLFIFHQQIPRSKITLIRWNHFCF